MCRQIDGLADEDHTHHLTPEEIRDYRVNWWIRSNKVGPDTMLIRHRPDFKQALSTLRQLKDKEDAAINKDGRKAIPRLGGTGKNPGGILLMSIMIEK